MEKEVVWTAVSRKDFWEVVSYLKENWQEDVLEKFSSALALKVQLLQSNQIWGSKARNIHVSEERLFQNITP
jgi:plasmid stabilization system protein ParE